MDQEHMFAGVASFGRDLCEDSRVDSASSKEDILLVLPASCTTSVFSSRDTPRHSHMCETACMHKSFSARRFMEATIACQGSPI